MQEREFGSHFASESINHIEWQNAIATELNGLQISIIWTVGIEKVLISCLSIR